MQRNSESTSTVRMEFSFAKDQNIFLRICQFSDGSICYLSVDLPVIVQDISIDFLLDYKLAIVSELTHCYRKVIMKWGF